MPPSPTKAYKSNLILIPKPVIIYKAIEKRHNYPNAPKGLQLFARKHIHIRTNATRNNTHRSYCSGMLGCSATVLWYFIMRLKLRSQSSHCKIQLTGFKAKASDKIPTIRRMGSLDIFSYQIQAFSLGIGMGFWDSARA